MTPLYEIRQDCCGLGHGSLGVYLTRQDAEANQPEPHLMRTQVVAICTSDDLAYRLRELANAYVIQASTCKSLYAEEAKWRHMANDLQDKLDR